MPQCLPQHALSAGYLFDETLGVTALRTWIASLRIDNAMVLLTCQTPPEGHAAEQQHPPQSQSQSLGEGETKAPPPRKKRALQRYCDY